MTLAARYLGNGLVDVAEVEVAEPAADEVQIAVAYTGICGTDLHILHGGMDNRVSVPAVVGHEMSGVVACVGSAVSDWRVGDPVSVMPLRWCGSCAACRRGHRHVCQNLDFMGIDSPGSMQGRWNVPESVLVRLPPNMPLDQAALLEPAAVAVHDVRRSDLTGTETAIVVGGGPVGVLIALVARATGADVVICELDDYRREVARRLGLAAIDPGATDVADHVTRWTHGAGADVAFEVTGSQGGLDTAVRSLAVRGRGVLVGIHGQPRTVDLLRVFLRELDLRGARVYRRADFTEATTLLASGALGTDVLITHTDPLSSAAQSFMRLEAGDQVMKVLVDCRGG